MISINRRHRLSRYCQVQDLVNQNTSLQQTLELKNAEIQALRGQLSSVPDGSSDIAARKIKELAKKNRDLNLGLERERLKVSRLERDVAGAATEAGKRAQRTARPSSAASNEEGGQQGRHSEVVQHKAAIKEWKEKFAQSNLRVTELRQELQGTKVEYSKMRRALQREVGEDVELGKVLDESTNWRGRAQQVALLQQKLKNMKKQLDLSEAGSVMGDTVVACPSNKEMDLDDKHRAEIESLAQRRGHSKDELGARLAKAEEDLLASKTRYEAASARSRTLEGEVRNMKSKLQVLLDKTDNDDKLIDAIRGEMNKAQDKERATRKELAAARTGRPAASSEEQGQMLSGSQMMSGTDARVSVGQHMKVQEQHLQALEMAKKETVAVRAEMVTLQQKLRQATSEGSRLKVNASQHNDVVMKAKLQEVEAQKVKEFCELLQGDIEAADRDAVAAEAALQQERSMRVGLEKQVERGKRGSTPKDPPHAQHAEERRVSVTQIQTLQLELKKLQREGSLATQVHARQRSVYECGIRELMRMVQLQNAPEGSSKMVSLLEENDKLREEVRQIKLRMV
eukprot:TRINITY_DN3910_c0_g1_i4.p1 TRINITY_DN3910_c0_g1~~TRINITY_DN3910_c0_g1_i4.p1  ORF type:complete len:569 (-),score=199.33 TRINITY_DN3910_c0_g1_i4:87-1793(-)